MSICSTSSGVGLKLVSRVINFDEVGGWNFCLFMRDLWCSSEQLVFPVHTSLWDCDQIGLERERAQDERERIERKRVSGLKV